MTWLAVSIALFACVTGAVFLPRIGVPEQSIPSSGVPRTVAPEAGVLPQPGTLALLSPDLLDQTGAILAGLRSLSESDRRLLSEAWLNALRGLGTDCFNKAIGDFARELAVLQINDGDQLFAAEFYEFLAQQQTPSSYRLGALAQLGWLYLYADSSGLFWDESVYALEELLAVLDAESTTQAVSPDLVLDTHRKLAFIAAARNTPAAALEHYNAALERVGDSISSKERVQLLKDLARQSARVGLSEQSMEFARRVLDEPEYQSDDRAHWILETAALSGHSYDDARYSAILERVVLEPSLAASPHSLTSRWMLAYSYERQGMPEDAMNVLRESFDRFSQTPLPSIDGEDLEHKMGMIGFRLGELLVAQGDEQGARDAFARVARLFPNSEHGRYALRLLNGR